MRKHLIVMYTILNLTQDGEGYGKILSQGKIEMFKPTLRKRLRVVDRSTAHKYLPHSLQYLCRETATEYNVELFACGPC